MIFAQHIFHSFVVTLLCRIHYPNSDKKYTFLVHPEANKTMIKEAVEKMFEGAKVAKVNTMNLDGKTKRRGMVYGKTAKTKKAVVQLTEDSKDIEIFTGL